MKLEWYWNEMRNVRTKMELDLLKVMAQNDDDIDDSDYEGFLLEYKLKEKRVKNDR